ncbi:MAG: DUF4981 domain-containing protein, partial [Opitutaceae bacterium]|nr:DUF4981 domain-containing protein [Opitutaceae bacterium]
MNPKSAAALKSRRFPNPLFPGAGGLGGPRCLPKNFTPSPSLPFAFATAGAFAAALALGAALAFATPAAVAAPVSLYPARAAGFSESLNGDWSFKYLPGSDAGDAADFHAPRFDVSGWEKIRVPGNWELQGFAEPRYALKLKDGLGLHRRAFRVPAEWLKERDGRRRVVCLRFDGVAYGFEAWVNGRPVGASSASAYNPHTFDITGALHADAGNVLAVRVATKPLGYEFDVNDDWSLSGIFRDVTLFSVPATHVRDVATRTTLAADGSAELQVSVSVGNTGANASHTGPDSNGAGANIRARLFAPDGALAADFDLPRQPGADGSHGATARVARPQLWTAETPSLYRLQLTLATAGGGVLQTIEERVGLREVSVVDGVLLLNGRPVKLRGVNHHDIDPDSGRAMTGAQIRRDLAMMRKANINFVRTSHYPPHPRLLDLCDELGFYVMDEVAIGKGEKNLEKPEYRDNILGRVEPTITRDKNHASVIIWSIGNENPVTEVEMDASRLAKKLDPTRPVCIPKIGSYFAKNHQRIPEFVDIFAPHYPSNATMRDYATRLDRPTIFTEYAHALGLATDRVQEQWDILQKTPRFAGGAIWHFMDQGILRRREQPVDRDQPAEYVWLDAHRYHDTNGPDGTDGIVYSDRSPQTDFWQVRKVYSPVQIAEKSAAVKPGAQEIALTVENRHDFRALAGMRLAWSLRRDNEELQTGEIPLRAAARECETVKIPVSVPTNTGGGVLTLETRCLDEAGAQITERVTRLELPGADPAAWLGALPAAATKPDVAENSSEVKITLPRWTLAVARATGELTIRDRAGRVLVAGIYPHAGRKLTMAEARGAERSNLWRGSTLAPAGTPEIKVATQKAGAGVAVALSVSGRYPRADKPGEGALTGGYRAEITPAGVIKISYDYAIISAPAAGDAAAGARLSEAGLSLVLPSPMTEFRWAGAGPYAGYPGKDRLNEFGLFHLNREDLYFQGNRRETELALVTTPEGAGVALVSAPSDIAVER